MADFKSWRRDTLDQFAAEAARKMREQAIEIGRLKDLLAEAAPHVYSAAGAEHLLDGFKPQRRPLDDLAERVRQELEAPTLQNERN